VPLHNKLPREAVAPIHKMVKCLGASNWFEDVELGTGETIGVRTMPNWYSDDIRDWCNAAPNRYFMCHTARDGSERDIGMRPCFAPTWLRFLEGHESKRRSFPAPPLALENL